MRTIEEIRELKTYYEKDLYSKTREEQRKDQEYRDDTFGIPEVKAPHQVLRLGMGARMVDAPAEQIITSNPQALFKVLKGDKEIENRLNKLVNEEWIPLLRRQNPNPFKESVKNKLSRGENYIHVWHNKQWVTKPIGKDAKKMPIFNRIGLPVHFVILDPMIIYGSPQENDCGWIPDIGVPNNVFIMCEKQPQDIIDSYPKWTNPKGAGIGKNEKMKVDWWGYFDKDVVYFEADGESLLPELAENIYGFTPFVRAYSGFGRRSPDGELANLIVGDLRFSRGLIHEKYLMRSDIASVMHLAAHKPKTLISPGEINKKSIKANLSFGAYDLNVLDNVPDGTKFIDEQIDPPTAEAFQHLHDIDAEITQRNPFLMAGFPFGSSGRQQDMTQMAGMRRYDTIIENTELPWATAIEMALKICKEVPTLKPDGLNKSDLDAKFKCEIKLKASDPVEEDRKATLGDRMWNNGNGAIDLRTNLIRYQGFTPDEAEEIIANNLVDKLTLYNPDVAQVMGMVFAEESGMAKWIEEAQQKRMMIEQQQKGLQEPPPATTTERTKGEVQSPQGREMIDMALSSKGARRPPERYNRGQ